MVVEDAIDFEVKVFLRSKGFVNAKKKKRLKQIFPQQR